MRQQVSQAEELAERLKEWAVREMGFQKGREEMLSLEDFKMYGSLLGTDQLGYVKEPSLC